MKLLSLSPRVRVLTLLLLAGCLLTGCSSGSRRYLAGLWSTPVEEPREGDDATDADGEARVAEKSGWFPWRSSQKEAGAERVAASDAAPGTTRAKAGSAKVADGTAGETEGTASARSSGTIFSAFVKKREPERDMTRDPFLGDYEQVEYRRSQADVAAASPFVQQSSSAGKATVANDADGSTPTQTGFATDFDSEMRRLKNALAKDESPEGRLDWARDESPQTAAVSGPAADRRAPRDSSVSASGNARAASSAPRLPLEDQTPPVAAKPPVASAPADDFGFRSPSELAAARNAEPARDTASASAPASPSAPTTPFAPVASSAKEPVDPPPEANPFVAVARAEDAAADAIAAPTVSTPDVPVSPPRIAAAPQIAAAPTGTTSEPAFVAPQSAASLDDPAMIVDTESLLRRGSRVLRPAMRPSSPAASQGPRADAAPRAASEAISDEPARPLIIAPRPTAWRAAEANRPKTLQVSHDIDASSAATREVQPLATPVPVDVASAEPRALAMQGADVSGAGLAPESLIERVRRQTEVALYVPDGPQTSVVPEGTAGAGGSSADRLPLSFRLSADDASAAPAPRLEPAPSAVPPQAAATDVAWEDEPLPVVTAPAQRGRNVLRVAFALALVGGIGWGLRRRLGRPAV